MTGREIKWSVQAPVLHQPKQPNAPSKAITTQSKYVVYLKLMYTNKNPHYCLQPLEYPLLFKYTQHGHAQNKHNNNNYYNYVSTATFNKKNNQLLNAVHVHDSIGS